MTNTKKKNRVLAIDDEPAMIEWLKILLEHEGYEVRTAMIGTRGEEAPSSVSAHGGRFAIDDDRTVPDTLESVFAFASGRLAIFSHGLLSEPQVYRSLLSHLASHGFIVACPIHDDSLMERGLRMRSAAVDGGAAWNLGGISGDADAWAARARACASVLDEASVVLNAVNMVALTERPLLVGHELGAFTAMLLMGASARSGDGRARAPASARQTA